MNHRTASGGGRTRGWRGTRLGRVYHHRRSRSESGAALIEAAIILPVLMIFLLGIIEFGLVYATGATATGASRSGARLAAATFGPNRSDLHNSSNTGAADQVAAAASADLQALTSAVPVGMVVYQVARPVATNTDGKPNGGFPAENATMNGGCTSNCLRYTWDTSTKQMKYSSGTWPTAQVDACTAASIDNVGVWVLVRHSYLTKLIGQYNYISGKTVMRLEPLPTDQCS